MDVNRFAIRLLLRANKPEREQKVDVLTRGIWMKNVPGRMIAVA